MAAGRRRYLGLVFLDRQLVDRDGRMAGKVDDLELSYNETGDTLYVTAILTGPGYLAPRLGAERYGRWAQARRECLSGTGTSSRIPFSRVVDVGNHVDLAADRTEIATYDTERWFLDHFIDRIPGWTHAPE
jgi:sporulation protein YlmC with PRC-barrel domain